VIVIWCSDLQCLLVVADLVAFLPDEAVELPLPHRTHGLSFGGNATSRELQN
jgi:hypothetical protein